MHIRPILSALRHHRLTTAMIVLEIALACAVLCNACFVVVGQLRIAHIRSGIDEPSLAVITLGNFDRSRTADINARVLAGLRGIDGVTAVDAIDGLPFVDAGGSSVSSDPEGKQGRYPADFYFGDRGTLRTLGVRLLEGRLPGDAELASADDKIQRVYVTRSLARQLWPQQDPLGQVMWCCHGSGELRVVGVLQRLIHAEPRDGTAVEWSVFTAQRPGAMSSAQYLLRASPDRLDAVLRQARMSMGKLVPDATLTDEMTGTVSELRDRYFQSNRATSGMLVGTMLALLAVTALGIVGLSGYWVQQRRKQIGVRRALGATRGDIVRHFQTENFLIVTFGILLGAVLAYVFNMMLMTHYELPHMPPGYLLVAAAVLWLLGQLAVLAPALRAGRVPPVVATRSV
ncbi:MAG TPA: FtsX-like permease family protein [Rhodanobacter sp.]|nr:FtsX-like permease family protein [Rhodanobacter sp.]